MSTKTTTDQADAAAKVLERMLSTGTGSQGVLSELDREVLGALTGRYAHYANAVRRVSQPLLPLLPGDDDLGDAPAFATFPDALAWYLKNADSIFSTLVLASRHGVYDHVSRVVRGLEYVLTSIHDIDRGLALAELDLHAARHLGDKAAEAYALLNRGGSYKMAGRPAQAVDDLQQAARLLAELNNEPGTIAALSRLSVAFAAARQLDKADDTLNQILALDHDGVLPALAHVNRAWVSSQRGAWGTAIPHGRVGLERLEACDADRTLLLAAHLELVRACTGAGDFVQARQHLSSVWLLVADGADTVPQRVAVSLHEGELLLAQGHHQDAVTAFRQAVKLQAPAPRPPYRTADAFDGLGQALFGLGEFDLAAEQHTAALSERLRTGEPFATARSRYHLARAKAASGRSDEAAQERRLALLDLAEIADPAADALRNELNRPAI
jgi:tetratricopeptide (TPR) repeat protein